MYYYVTRPNINFNKSEICSACLSSKEKEKIIDWKSRELEFIKVVKRVKKSVIMIVLYQLVVVKIVYGKL